jgi:hypothetical protein
MRSWRRELHRAEVVVVGFAAAAEAPGHRLEGDVADGRGDESCVWVGKVTKVSTKGQAVYVVTEGDAPKQDMQIQLTPQQLSMLFEKVGSVRPINGRRKELRINLGLGELAKGKMAEELNRGHSLLLVLDVRRRPSLDDDDFE